MEEPDVEVKDDIWLNEEELLFAGIDERLWSDHDSSQQPPVPEEDIDKLADEVEIGRVIDNEGLGEFH